MCIEIFTESPPDCEYLIRTENHFGKFDIFILFYVFKQTLDLLSHFLCLPKAHTGFKHI